MNSLPSVPPFDRPTALRLSDFDFDLPPELIAQAPLAERSASRLLHVAHDGLHDRGMRDLPALLAPGDLLIFNDSRVLHARLYGCKESGGQIEVLVERPLGEHEALAQVRASKSPRAGTRLLLADGAIEAEVLGRIGEFFHLRFGLRSGDPAPLLALLEQYGRLPLPPYIARAAGAADEARYQTVFARAPGSVAAPTAGLHFDADLLDALAARGLTHAYVTLHVGAGTFQPVRVEDLSQHRMHRELYYVPEATVAAIAAARGAGRKIIAVGTTSLRALESAASGGSLRGGGGETELFITPGYRFQVPDLLLTNFHLPRSTLLMLVSAFGGSARLRAAYAHAIAQRYRFFSYGDAMLLEPMR